MPRPSAPLELQAARVDLDRGIVVRADGSERQLTTKELDLLAHLVASAGRVVSRDELHAAVWGIGQAVVTRAVDNAVAKLRAKIEDNPRRPRHVLTVYGDGYRFVPLEAPPARASSLPAESDPFVGRAGELAAIERAFTGARIVTLAGPGGAGKTRLAVRYAARWPDRVAFAELRPARDRDGVWGAVARAAGLVGQAPIAALADAGVDLVVLDNAEHVLGPVQDVLVELAGVARVLVTSREALGAAGERVLAVGPLPLADALELLRVRARRSAWDAPQLPDAARLVERVDRLPLAIEVAAARVDLLGLRGVVERLDERLAILRTPGRRGPHEAVGWSWSLLSDAGRAALAALSVFPASFSLDAAAAVAGDAVVDALSELVRHHLVRTADAGSDRRFVLLDTVRAFAADHRPAGLEARLAGWYAGRAAGWRLAAERDPLARRRLAAEQAGLLRAIDHASGADAAEIALAASPLLGGEGTLDGWLRAVEGVADPRVDVARAEALRLVGRVPEAEAILRERASGADDVAALALVQLATLLRLTGRPADGEDAGKRAAGLLDRPGDLLAGPERSRWLAIARAQTAAAAARLGRTDAARAGFERAARDLRRDGFARNAAIVHGNLGALHLDAHRFAEAEACFAEALAVHRAWGDRRNEAIALGNLGAVLLQLGRDAEAADVLREAEDLYRRAGDRLHASHARLNRGLAALAAGSPSAERDLWSAAEECASLGDRLVAAHARGHLGIARVLRGRSAEGLADLDGAAASAREAGHAPTAALFELWTAYVRGDPLPEPAEPHLAPVRAALAGEDVPPASLDVRLALATPRDNVPRRPA